MNDVDPMDRWRFPDDPWALVETAPSTRDLGHTETPVSYTHLTLPTTPYV